MPAHSSFNSFGPQPDPSPAGAEGLAMRQRPQMHLASSDEQPGRMTLKPEIPRKNKHVEEIYRLKQRLSDLQSENDQVHDSIGLIASDLDEAEQKLAMKTKELEGVEAELAAMRQEVQTLSAHLDQEKQNRASFEMKLGGREAEWTAIQQHVQVLSAQLDQERQSRTRVEDTLRLQETSREAQSSGMQQKMESLLAAMEHKGAQESGEVARLQAEVFRLTNVVANRDEELKKSQFMAAESERRLAGQLLDQSAQIEQLKRGEVMATESDQNWANQLHDQHERLEEQIKLREAAEAALLAQQQPASAGLEMAELRRMCAFYQANSERLSRQIKQKLVTVAKAPNDGAVKKR